MFRKYLVRQKRGFGIQVTTYEGRSSQRKKNFPNYEVPKFPKNSDSVETINPRRKHHTYIHHIAAISLIIKIISIIWVVPINYRGIKHSHNSNGWFGGITPSCKQYMGGSAYHQAPSNHTIHHNKNNIHGIEITQHKQKIDFSIKGTCGCYSAWVEVA